MAIHAAQNNLDYNTDQGNGTHKLCVQLLQDIASKSAVLSKPMEIRSDTLHAMMLTRVQHAASTAEKLAETARIQTGSVAQAIFMVLNHGSIRRGAPKSELGYEGCLSVIEAALAKPGPLRLAVLTFPFRDRNPFKNVGALPDAGEAETLVRFWTIGKAIACLGVPCKVVALRDGTRYPSAGHYPMEEKRRYGVALQDIVKALGLGEHLEFHDVDERTDEECQEAYEIRQAGHKKMFDEEMASMLETFGRHRTELLSACSEDKFGQVMNGIPGGDALLPVFYAMLHWLPPSVTPSCSGETYGMQERSDVMHRVANIFTPCVDDFLESSRQDLVWETLHSTFQYVSAYRSRSAANNTLGLDDVMAVAPGALRMSIHNKSKDNGIQFPVSVGANPHRTPWHGTAEARFSKRNRALIFDTKLAAEMWTSHVAVLPTIPSSESAGCQAALESTDESSVLAWQRYCTNLGKSKQPFFFADTSTLPSEWHSDSVLSSLPMPAKESPEFLKTQKRLKRARLAGA